jgi:hypothetical protein
MSCGPRKFPSISISASGGVDDYIVLLVGTNLAPRHLRFKDWKRWLRIELLLCSVAFIGGLGKLLCMVHSAVPLVIALPSWCREGNYKDAFSPVAIKASRTPISQFW